MHILTDEEQSAPNIDCINLSAIENSWVDKLLCAGSYRLVGLHFHIVHEIGNCGLNYCECYRSGCHLLEVWVFMKCTFGSVAVVDLVSWVAGSIFNCNCHHAIVFCDKFTIGSKCDECTFVQIVGTNLTHPNIFIYTATDIIPELAIAVLYG